MVRSVLSRNRDRSGDVLRQVLTAASLVLVLGLGWRRSTSDARVDHPGPPPDGTESVLVLEALDGDTLRLADGRRVRILGLDTPETHHPGMTGPQPGGAEAAARLKGLVEGRRVGLERDRSDHDAYGRLLRHVWLGKELVAARLLAEGLAWPLSIPPDMGHQDRLAGAANAARAARRGLWGQARPTSLAVFGHPAAARPNGRASGQAEGRR
jgi:endonuclease YncB( thermonuclease family)